MHKADTLDKGAAQILGGAEWDSVGFHHAAQKGTHFKSYELFAPGIFHFVFSDCS